jgi:hypothetical protein
MNCKHCDSTLDWEELAGGEFCPNGCDQTRPPTIKDAMKAMDVIEAEIIEMPEGIDKSIAAQSFLDLVVILAKVNAKLAD